jgi:hypothetical protein
MGPKLEKVLSRREGQFASDLRSALKRAIDKDCTDIFENDLYDSLRIQLGVRAKSLPTLLMDALEIIELRRSLGLPLESCDAFKYDRLCRMHCDKQNEQRPGPRRMLALLESQLDDA